MHSPENGVLTTQRPIPAGGATDCTSNGAMANIFAVTARRYPIVDEEAGVVLGLGLFERQARCGDAAEFFQRVVRHRAEQDPVDLFRDVLSGAGGDHAELAAVRWELAGGAAAEVAANQFSTDARRPSCPADRNCTPTLRGGVRLPRRSPLRESRSRPAACSGRTCPCKYSRGSCSRALPPPNPLPPRPVKLWRP